MYASERVETQDPPLDEGPAPFLRTIGEYYAGYVDLCRSPRSSFVPETEVRLPGRS